MIQFVSKSYFYLNKTFYNKARNKENKFKSKKLSLK